MQPWRRWDITFFWSISTHKETRQPAWVWSQRQREYTTYDLILDDAPLDDVIRETTVDGLLLAPSTTDLSSADIEMMSIEKRSFLLHDALRQPAIDAYELDYILIDCPPSLSLLTINAMVASDSVLDPFAK